MKLLKYLVPVLSLLLVTSCFNDDEFNADTSTNNSQKVDPVIAQNFGATIQRNFLGTVADINGSPLVNVKITIGNDEVRTDDNGVFIINNAQVFERFGYIKAQKIGFIDASRSVVPTDGTNQVKITMLPKNTTATTQSGTVETISLSNGAAVALQGAYVKENGEAYNGTVKVTLHHLDAAAPETQDQMPGMLYAQDAQGQERGLVTMGMLAVELTGSNGEDLNLAAGTTAEITVPVSQSLLVNAPQTIPLWYFNEEHGFWVEDGEATLQGDRYVGTVSHFSFWNFDIPVEKILLTVNVFDVLNQPFADIFVMIGSEFHGFRYATTNSLGQIRGFVPANQNLTYQIFFNGYCINESLPIQSIGPYTSDTEINLTGIELPDDTILSIETIEGQFTGCENIPIVNGYVRIYNNGVFTSANVVDGNFNTTIIRCLDDVNLNFAYHGYNYDTGQTSQIYTGEFTDPVTIIEITEACIEPPEPTGYFSIVLEDISQGFDSNLNYVTPNPNGFSMWTKHYIDDHLNMYLTLPSNELGVYNSNDEGVLFEFYLDSTHFFHSDYFEHNITFNLLEFGEIDEFIEVTYAGTYVDEFNETQEVTGTMSIIRSF
ncbi:hypothetical protein ULMA_11790 [Patiriisocius marinus]|uniref:Carboxypeptidase regulatory-like domain-containing protein n=1 Tax=Patiriisocius marinus TaxID=1397112 RepID=A0A5J4IZT9_9FLAO|nr:carboxypeptidase-like regulatory domain-containing protein [Patiriisocius marinus]GER59071.1 hypothetical protein ULMA_11790 [Patiriisocius marinus]